MTILSSSEEQRIISAQNILIAHCFSRIAELEKRVSIDALTQVRSQNNLVSVWDKSQETPLTAIAIDVVGLGEINREQGHDQGDLLLQNVAQQLKCVVREKDCVYRRGGDEFVVLLPIVDTDKIIENRIKALPFDLYVGSASGRGRIFDLIQQAFNVVERQKREK